jgi:hypothetical protein
VRDFASALRAVKTQIRWARPLYQRSNVTSPFDPGSVKASRSAPAAATTSPELAQLEPMARDLTAMRRSLEQLAAKQEQMAQTITTLQAVEQDIKQKMSSPPLSQAVPIPPRKPPRPSAPSSTVQSPPAPAPPPVARSPLVPTVDRK